MKESIHSGCLRPKQNSPNACLCGTVRNTRESFGASLFVAYVQGKVSELTKAVLAKDYVHSHSISCGLSRSNMLPENTFCQQCKRILLNEKEHGGYLEFSTSGRGTKELEFSRSKLRLKYERSDVFPSLPSLSAGAKSNCQFCQLLKTSLTGILGDDLQKPAGPVVVRIGGLQYCWEDGLQGLELGQVLPDIGISSPNYPCLMSQNGLLLSPQVSKRIEGWIGQCLKHCDPEAKPMGLPTRLLDVGNMNGRKVRLVVTSDKMLQGKSGRSWRYSALSHCWGDRSIHKPPLKTTTENLSKRLAGIPFLDLPKTYQHAIIVCRSLNIQYLWIDSLCIIQNDKADWETESPKMAQYYEHAYITIIPAAATSCNDGFLDRPITQSRPVKVEFQSSLKRNTRGAYFIHGESTTEPRFSQFYDDIAKSKWGTRGWTFCEGLFSTRRVYFGKNTIHWGCRKFYTSELSNILDDAEEHNLQSLIEEQDQDQFHDGNVLSVWYAQYLEYSCRQFTRSQDRLPAISPLAKVMAQLTGDTYLAGLWQSDLHVGLLWYADSFEGPLILPREKEASYIAPSWSWLARARNAEISDYALTHKTQSLLIILGTRITPDGINPYGRVLDGSIEVDGYTSELPRDMFIGSIHQRGTNYRTTRFQGHEVECSLDEPLGMQVQSYVLLVVRNGLCLKDTIYGESEDIDEDNAHYAVSGLVLIPSGQRENAYCRAGIFQSLRNNIEEKSFLITCKRRTLILI
ncbi:uncharacterized protein K452DRAFT_312990 [Aplosporella prunicola CBS 121167]|uniref:Heterokaryon incompatibility domain-containing protein n=1 Tax=Aplosporella prunicola CBS 121167 TaxID=1176127 RepID=A0A6A6B106_9PEZI|nr:uncharacterized protein K452DRAFT_312990 [Aplosporella prunicola CBS 121167]KAF2136707.1 hypothetical protein K452DRAFT_312990 [Aplosporella prunicola CBS 121167]